MIVVHTRLGRDFCTPSGATKGRLSARESMRSFGGKGNELSNNRNVPLHPWHLDIQLVMNLKVKGLIQ